MEPKILAQDGYFVINGVTYYIIHEKELTRVNQLLSKLTNKDDER